MTGRLPVVLVSLGFTLLLAAWVVGTQPFDAPDEPPHYLRALGISEGVLLGPKVQNTMPGLDAAQLQWTQQGLRGITVPPAMAPPQINCQNGPPDHGPGSCVEGTDVGNYHPLPYLLPAAGLKLADNETTGLWFGRAASAFQCLVFLLLATAFLWSGSLWSLVGLLLAVTPMVLFVSSVINPNGLEIASSLAFTCGLIRVSRSPGQTPGWVWPAVALSGAATILSWQLGPVFAVADLALFAGLVGRPGWRTIARPGRRAPRLAGLALAAALAVYLAYGLASGVAHTRVGFTPFVGSLHAAARQLPSVLGDSVGNFGVVSVPLPVIARWIWWLLVAGVVGVALRHARRRERRLLVSVALLALLFPILFYAWVYEYTGFGLQGRYVLPVMVLIPLLAGELLFRHLPPGLSARRGRVALGALVALVAGFQAYAWWYDARTAANLLHSLGLFGHAGWRPPGGWAPWALAAAAGCLLILAAGAVNLRGSRLRTAPSG